MGDARAAWEMRELRGIGAKVGLTLDGSAAGHYTKKKQTETECATQTLVGWYNHCEGRVLGWRATLCRIGLMATTTDL